MDVDLIYLLLDEKPKEDLTIKGETFKYLVKVRRHGIGDEIHVRYKESMENLRKYEIVSIDNRSLNAKLVSSELKEVKSPKDLHVAWCAIDSRSIEKVLPSLSEIGVARISFISCDRSQKNFKLDFKRFERILEASMQQSGRSVYMRFDEYKNLKEFVGEFPNVKALDFCDETLGNDSNFETILVGCEGGFSKEEKELLSSLEVFSLDTPMVLRSESAVMAVASKILL